MTLFSSLRENKLLWPSSGLILYLLCLLVIANFLHRLQRWQRLRHVPGPPLAGWTSLWQTRHIVKGLFSQEVQGLTDKYGPVIRVGPNKVICTDIDALYRITGVRSAYTKNEWYTIGRVSDDGDSILSMTDPELRKKRKKQIMSAYAGKGVDNFEDGVDKALAAWIDLIERKYLSAGDKSVPMDFGEKANFYTLDAMGEVACSESFGALKTDKDVYDMVATNQAMSPMIMIVGNHIGIWRLLKKWPFKLLLPHDGDEAGFGATIGQINKLINRRLLGNDPPRRDMLQSFIAHGLRGEDLKQEVSIQFFAGTDTTASALRAIFLLLLTTPAAYAQLQAELDAIIKPHDRSNPSSSILPNDTIRTLPYLQSTILESLRLFPPGAPLQLLKQVPASGDTLCGVTLPGGTVVATGCAVWAVCRDKRFWGDDADVFRPGRWLEGDKEGLDGERLAAMMRRVEMVWGCGQFVCVGKGLAMVEIGKAVAELMRRYDWSLVNPMRLPKLATNGLWGANDFWVRVENR